MCHVKYFLLLENSTYIFVTLGQYTPLILVLSWTLPGSGRFHGATSGLLSRTPSVPGNNHNNWIS